MRARSLPSRTQLPQATVLRAGIVMSAWNFDGERYFAKLHCEANQGYYVDEVSVMPEELSANGDVALRDLITMRVDIAQRSLETIIARERWLTPFRWLLRRLGLMGIYNRCTLWLRDLRAYLDDVDEDED